MDKLPHVVLISIQFILIASSIAVERWRDRNLRDGDLSDRIVFATTRAEDPKIWFNTEHPQFVYIGQISWVTQEKAQIRVRKTLDTEWPNLWYFNGDVSPSMKIIEAWRSGYSGNGVVIAVLDDGVQMDHPDLAANIDTINGTDVYENDDDPYPAEGSSHGTEVSGFIAAVRDNNICTVGVAYNSKIVGVRVLGEVAILDSDEARALSHKLDYVDIYSNSWGPKDGKDFSKPEILAEKALIEGVKQGRNGKGAIYLWASGNGGVDDNCNADAYSNSIYTIAIAAVEIGKNAWYSEVCTCALAAAYGGSQHDRFLTTTSTGSTCTHNGIQGTSYATPIAAGIVALCLEANPNLTWRDIQHIIVLTSSRNEFKDTYAGWTSNGAHKEFSQLLGFGLMNAEAMVNQSKTWVTVPEQENCTSATRNPFVSSEELFNSIDVITVSTKDCARVSFLEHVTVNITFSFSAYRGATLLYLVSPKGTTSHLLHHRVADGDQNTGGSLTWTFMSVHFWRESPIGNWTLEVGSHAGISTVTLDSWSLTFYGTSTDPLPHVNQCSSSPCPGNTNCVNFVYKYICCPRGYTGENCEKFQGETTTPNGQLYSSSLTPAQPLSSSFVSYPTSSGPSSPHTITTNQIRSTQQFGTKSTSIIATSIQHTVISMNLSSFYISQTSLASVSSVVQTSLNNTNINEASKDVADMSITVVVAIIVFLFTV